LIVEDEPQLRELVCASVENSGYRCAQAATAREAISEVENHRPDLVVVDLGLPDRDGMEVIKSVRQWSAMPVIVLSARSKEADKVLALDAGADDFVTKPFSTGELLARMRVALRHAAARGRSDSEAIFACRDLKVDVLRRRVSVRGEEVHLTPIEFRLLCALIRKSGQVVTHADLLNEAWGPGRSEQDHYLRIYMAGLRRKIEADPARPSYLLTEVGVGYRLADE
jgi:two-component system KDP operon response regulator KdpE